MERSTPIVAGKLATTCVLLTQLFFVGVSHAVEGPDFTCEIMPLAFPADPIQTSAESKQWSQFPLGPAQGHIGWISWDGTRSLTSLTAGLTPPGTAELYRPPEGDTPKKLEAGDWMEAVPGVRNGQSVRNALDNLIGQRIRVPLYDNMRGSVGALDYHLDHFIWIVPQEYNLAGKSWMTFTYEGEAPCRENQPPEIISTPSPNAVTGETYRYTIEATDPDFDIGDIIKYTLQDGPDGITVNATSGELSWLVGDDWVGTNTAPNSYCLASSGEGEAGSADVVMVVDESGSMSNEHAWIKDLALPLEAHLKSSDVGSGASPNHYGLIGYEKTPRPILLDDSRMGSWEALRRGADSLKLYGGTEDGWRAIRYALTDYPLRDSAAKNIILITDEGRDITASWISYNSILSDLRSRNALLNAVVNARFVCNDSEGKQVSALGMDSEHTGYLADGEGGYQTCSNARATWGHTNTTSTLSSYVNLALDSGGAAWDLDYLRAGGKMAESFTEALIAIKVREIKEQLPPTPLPDLYISHVSEQTEGIAVVVGNRGQVDVNTPVSVSLVGENGAVISTQAINGLAQSETKNIIFALPSDVAGELNISITADGMTECLQENNAVTVPWVSVRAEDWNGLYDEQHFVLSVSTPNRAPQIVSEPVTKASAGAWYQYQVMVEDLNLGDGLIYRLETGPSGMRIDEVTGEIRYKPDFGQLGDHTVTVVVQDLAGESATQTYTLKVEQNYILPKFTSTPYVRAVQSLEYNYQAVVASDELAELTFNVIYGPPGLVINDAGLISWNVPASFAGKSAEVVINVRDQYGNYDLQFFTLVGAASNASPVITSIPGAWTEMGQTYQYQLSATDADGDPLVYHLNNAPAGMQLEADSGLLTWAPTTSAADPVSVQVSVSDPYAAVASQSFTIKVYDGPNHVPVIHSEPVVQAWVGQTYQYQLNVEDVDGDPLTINLISAPAGVVWNSDTLALTWVPELSQQGANTFSIEVVDPRDGRAEQAFTVAVLVPNHPPEFESSPAMSSMFTGETFAYIAKAVDPDGDTLTYQLKESPAEVVFDTTSGILIWSPQAPGEYVFTIQALDGRDGVAEQTFTVVATLPPSLCHAPLAQN